MPVRASAHARGYGRQHQDLRASWAPQVDAGLIDCHAAICLHASRRIEAGARWDLGHTPDRSAYTGPEHERCNRSEGARRGNRARGRARQAQQQRSRDDLDPYRTTPGPSWVL